jgi:hypothetical protein
MLRPCCWQATRRAGAGRRSPLAPSSQGSGFGNQSRWGDQLCQSPRRSMPGWPGYARPSTPGSKKSPSAPASWCWPGRPPSSAAPQRPRSSQHRAGYRPRCTSHWLTRRGRLRRPCRCARHGLPRGHPGRAGPRQQYAAPPRPPGPATPRTPPPTSPPAVRAPAGWGAGASGPLGTGITSPGVAGGTTATTRGPATAAGPTVIADGTTVAGHTTSAGIAPVTALGKGDQAKKITKASTDRVRCRRWRWDWRSEPPRPALARCAPPCWPATPSQPPKCPRSTHGCSAPGRPCC